MIGKSILKFFTCAFALALLFVIAPVSAMALDASGVEAAIIAYNSTHGGSGSLTASVDTATNTITVTGSVTGATAGLELGDYTNPAVNSIDANVTIIWDAVLEGAAASYNNIPLLNIYSGGCTLKIESQSDINNTGNNTAVSVSGVLNDAATTIIINGGKLTAAATGYAISNSRGNMTIGGGAQITSGGYTAIQNLDAVTVTDAIISAPNGTAIISGGNVEISGANTQISGDVGINTTGTASIKGGQITATATDTSNRKAAVSADGGITMTGGSVTVSGSVASGAVGPASTPSKGLYSPSGNISVSGGSVTASGSEGVAIDAFGGSVTLGDGAVIAASGTDGRAILGAPGGVDIVGDVSMYGKLGDAPAAAVTLDIEANGKLTVPSGETLTVKMGSTINVKGGGKLESLGTLDVKGGTGSQFGTNVNVEADGMIENRGTIVGNATTTITNNGEIYTDTSRPSSITGVTPTGTNPKDLSEMPSTPAGGGGTTGPTGPTTPIPDPAIPDDTDDTDDTDANTPAPKKDEDSDKPAPVVPVLSGFTKAGDTFAFEVFVANGSGKMAGATVLVTLNGKYKATVTIGEDGVGRGVIEAPGFIGPEAIFSANVGGGMNVSVPLRVYSNDRLVRR